MNKKVIIFGLFTIISLASCSSDEPQWADPEAHEKMVQLQEQYGPLLVGTWQLEQEDDWITYRRGEAKPDF